MVVQRQLDAPATSAGDPICGLRTMAHDKVFCVVCMGTSPGGLRGGGGPQPGPGCCHGIEAARRLFPSLWFHAKHTQAGLEALGWYRKDDVRSVGLGPEHDWSIHAAGAFGLMCLVAEAGFRESRPTAVRRKGTAMAV